MFYKAGEILSAYRAWRNDIETAMTGDDLEYMVSAINTLAAREHYAALLKDRKSGLRTSRGRSTLAYLYCPDNEPLTAPKVGRFARHWLEKAAAQNRPSAMRDLAHCLRCGKCACCGRDIPRAEALESEANEIESIPRTWT